MTIDDSNPETSLANTRVKLTQALRIFDVRFRQMASGKDTLDQMLDFVQNLGMVKLRDLVQDDFELHVRLEQILIETLREAYEQQTLDSMGLSSTNKRL